MACSKVDFELIDGSICGICSEKSNIATRKLSCGHAFCENCLFTFLFDLKDNGKVDSRFQCPVCGTAHPLEETGKVTLEWIQSFPLATDVTGSDIDSSDVVSEPHEESLETIKCGPCAEEGNNIPGEKYCVECETHLCDTCVAAHEKFKLFRSHTFLDKCEVLDSENVLTDLQKLRKCQKHPDRDVELYCNDDEIFICLLCSSTTHKTCANLVEVSECSTEIEQNANDMKDRIDKTQKHLHVLHQLLVDKGTSIQAQTDTFVSEITDVKNEIVNSLEVIVENACARVTQLRQDVKENDTALAADIERLKEVFNKKRMYIDAMSKHHSPELLMGCTQLKADIESIEGEVMALDNGFENAEVDRTVIEKLKCVSQQLEPNEMPAMLIINKASVHEPKYSSLMKVLNPFVVNSVENHRVRLVRACSPTFTGISVRKDGHLILSDSCSRSIFYACGYVCIYNPSEKEQENMPMRYPYNATELNTQTVALTKISDKEISIVNVGREIKEERSLTTKYQPRGIVAMKNGNVAISWTDPPGFSIADISGATTEEIQYLSQDSDGRQFQSFDFMAVDEARKLVTQPCGKDKAVYGFSFTGKPVFKYTNGLKDPRGVAVDSKNGSVFVCDYADDIIHQLSARGQSVTVIQHEKLKKPLNVCYDTRRKCLWVTNEYAYDTIACFKQN